MRHNMLILYIISSHSQTGDPPSHCLENTCSVCCVWQPLHTHNCSWDWTIVSLAPVSWINKGGGKRMRSAERSTGSRSLTVTDLRTGNVHSQGIQHAWPQRELQLPQHLNLTAVTRRSLITGAESDTFTLTRTTDPDVTGLSQQTKLNSRVCHSNAHSCNLFPLLRVFQAPATSLNTTGYVMKPGQALKDPYY